MMKFKATAQILVDYYNWQCIKQKSGRGCIREQLAQPSQSSNNKIHIHNTSMSPQLHPKAEQNGLTISHKSHKTLCRVLHHCAYVAILTLVSHLHFLRSCEHQEQLCVQLLHPLGWGKGELCAGSPSRSNCFPRCIYSILILQRSCRQSLQNNMLDFPLFPVKWFTFTAQCHVAQVTRRPARASS